jgi:hypothetical protein
MASIWKYTLPNLAFRSALGSAHAIGIKHAKETERLPFVASPTMDVPAGELAA